MRKSNPRPPACKADALPTELIPLLMILMSLINKYFLPSSTKKQEYKRSKEQNKNIYEYIFYWTWYPYREKGPSWRSVDHFRGPQQTPAIFAQTPAIFAQTPSTWSTALLQSFYISFYSQKRADSKQQTQHTKHKQIFIANNTKKTCLLSE